MGLWSEIIISIPDPKDQNIKSTIDKILKEYDYDETWFRSTYSKEKGVVIDLRSTLDFKLIYPLVLDIQKAIKSHSYFEIGSYLL